MNLLKSILFFLLISHSIFSVENKIPMLFQLKWGASYQEVENRITQNDLNLKRLSYYSIYVNREMPTDLHASATIKFSSNGSPFFNTPSLIIFTFYNSSGAVEGLKLAKIEVYLNKKDNDNILIDTKSIFKNFLRIFLDNYDISLTYMQERQIYNNYRFQITINGIFVNFVANVGTDFLARDKSILISYESNDYQSMILKKESELIDVYNRSKNDPDQSLSKVKNNL